MSIKFKPNFLTIALMSFGVTLAVGKILHAMPTHAAAPAQPSAPANVTPHKVVVEIFQSQGCSSCPPANANFNALSNRPDVLALSFSVTYWDRLGWTDTFGRPSYTKRQEDYARGLRNPNVFTPQIVLDGRSDLVGNNPNELERAIAQAQRTPSQARIDRVGSSLSITNAQSIPSDIWLVSYEPQPILVAIKAGENNGKTLPHNHVVRNLVRLGTLPRGSGQIAIPLAGSGNLRRAVLVQGLNGGPMLGSAELS